MDGPVNSDPEPVKLDAREAFAAPELLVAPGSSEAEVLPEKTATVAVLVGLPAWTPSPVSVDTRTYVLYRSLCLDRHL